VAAENPVLNVLAEIPVFVVEVEVLESEVKAGITVTTPGIAASIAGIAGRLALTFTPNALLIPATVPAVS